MADDRLTGFRGATSFPGVAWHHGVMDVTTTNSPLLRDALSNGHVRLDDWKTNGVPLYVNIANAASAGTSLHLSNHSPLAVFQSTLFAGLDVQFDQRV